MATTDLKLNELVERLSFDLETEDFPSGQLHVVSYEGVEEISSLYHFDIHALVDQDQFDELDRTLFGSKATLTVGGHDSNTRAVHGIISRLDIEGVSGDQEGRHLLRLRLSPKLSTLQYRRNSRISQDATTESIVSALLDTHEIKHQWLLSRSYQPRRYCVQYRETDYDYIRRILAEDGIFFFFSSAPSGSEEMIVFGDTAAICKSIEGSSTLEFSDSEGEMFDRGDRVNRFARQTCVRTSATRVQRYDFERPEFDAHGQAAHVASQGGYDPKQLVTYDHEQIHDGCEANTELAKQHLQQHRQGANVAMGESRCRLLEVGKTFELAGNPISGLDGSYLLLRLKHSAKRPEYTSDAQSMVTYGNVFDCVPDAITPRPRRPERIVRQTLETATVVGPVAGEIYTDQYARIKVQFHWDLEGQRDESSSCWIRTMQNWAGAGWGFQFIPRVGMEVLVQFLGGDTDSPMVVGSAYNAKNLPPFKLPTDKTISGIRTQSSRGGGGSNELSFQDRKGYERVYVHAEKDLDELVEHNHTSTVHNDEVIRIGNCQTNQVGVNRSDLVGGDATYQVGVDRSLTVGHNETIAVQGMRSVEVQGSVREHVGRDRDLSVQGDLSAYVGGDHHMFVADSYDLNIGESCNDDAHATVAVNGDMQLLSTENITVRADKSLSLMCGDTRLILTPDGVTIAAKKIRVLGDDEIFLDAGAAVLQLDDNLLATAKKAEIHSQMSALVLDANANLDGTMVRLNCGPSSASADDSTDDESKTKPFEFTLLTPDDKPYAGKRYELAVEDQRWKGTTDGSGGIQQDIPIAARTAKVSVWIADKTREDYLVELAELPPVSELDGAQIRLRNLAYHSGDITGELDEPTKTALIWFQCDYELEQSGELDEATQAKLKEMAKF